MKCPEDNPSPFFTSLNLTFDPDHRRRCCSAFCFLYFVYFLLSRRALSPLNTPLGADKTRQSVWKQQGTVCVINKKSCSPHKRFILCAISVAETQAERVGSSDPVPGSPALLWAWRPGPPARLSVCGFGFYFPLVLVASLFYYLSSSYLNTPSSLPISHRFHLTPPPPPFTLPPATLYHTPPCLPSQTLHWIFHHKPPAACQSQRMVPPEAPTEGPASDIKRRIKANKRARIKMGRETKILPVRNRQEFLSSF